MRCKSKRGVAAVMAAWCVCDPMVTAAQAKGWSSEMRLLCDLHTIFFWQRQHLACIPTDREWNPIVPRPFLVLRYCRSSLRHGRWLSPVARRSEVRPSSVISHGGDRENRKCSRARDSGLQRDRGERYTPHREMTVAIITYRYCTILLSIVSMQTDDIVDIHLLPFSFLSVHSTTPFLSTRTYLT